MLSPAHASCTVPRSIRMLPSGFSRDVSLPSQFLWEFTSDCEARLAGLKARIAGLEDALSYVLDSAQSGSAVTADVLRQVLQATQADVIDVAGGPAATLHDMVISMFSFVPSVCKQAWRSRNQVALATCAPLAVHTGCGAHVA